MKINQYFLLFVIFLLGMLFSYVIGNGLIEGDEQDNQKLNDNYSTNGH